MHSRLADFLTNNPNSLQWSGKRECEELHALSSIENVAQRDKQVDNGIVASQPAALSYFVIHKSYVIGKLGSDIKDLTQLSANFSLFCPKVSSSREIIGLL